MREGRKDAACTETREGTEESNLAQTFVRLFLGRILGSEFTVYLYRTISTLRRLAASRASVLLTRPQSPWQLPWRDN